MSDENDLYSLFDRASIEIFSSTGLPFGSTSDKYRGFSDGNEGVQWNIAIEKNTCKTRLGINLEGKKYVDWPILKFLEKELISSEILGILKESNNDKIMFGLYRDAWQVRARPPIEEHIISGVERKAIEINFIQYENMLKEALECLSIEKAYRGRGNQVVTLMSGEKRKMQVSPHLTIFIPISFNDLDNETIIIKSILKVKNELYHIYKKLKEIIEY